MKTVVVWILLALVPFANLQMICVDHGSASAPEAGPSTASDCNEFCLREDAPPPPKQSESGCVLVAGGCSLLAALVVALPEPSLRFAAQVEDLDHAVPLERTPYVSPALQQPTPPPKS